MAQSKKSEPKPAFKIVGDDSPTDNNETQTAHADEQHSNDEIVLDEAEALARDALLDDDDGEEPGEKDEIAAPLVEKKLPKFANFRASLITFDLWGVTDRQGMDDLLFCTIKSFAPNFEDDVDLSRVRFFETVTTDRVIRLIWCFVPESKGKTNNWVTSKLAALEHSQHQWTAMRSRKLLQQYTYRPARRQDYSEPVFSGRTPVQWVVELRKLGMLVIDKNHPYYKKATDTEG
jgi:hypothetical protein